jgi:hypothetical protein
VEKARELLLIDCVVPFMPFSGVVAAAGAETHIARIMHGPRKMDEKPIYSMH